MSHTIEAAMARGELDEEEAFFVLRFAGHYGYRETMRRFDSPLRRARRWLIWIGGWEHPELSQWDLGKPAWEPQHEGRWNDPTPISILGHRFTYFGWGFSMRLGAGRLVGVWRWKPDTNDRWVGHFEQLYWSQDGTPKRDAVFFVGRYT